MVAGGRRQGVDRQQVRHEALAIVGPERSQAKIDQGLAERVVGRSEEPPARDVTLGATGDQPQHRQRRQGRDERQEEVHRGVVGPVHVVADHD